MSTYAIVSHMFFHMVHSVNHRVRKETNDVVIKSSFLKLSSFPELARLLIIVAVVDW